MVLHGQIHKLVLRLRLHHAGPLRPDHLNGALYVDLTVQPVLLQLIKDHVDHDKGARSADPGRTVHQDGARGVAGW